MATEELAEGEPTLYQRVWDDVGCASARFPIDLVFDNNKGGEWAAVGDDIPKVEGATGCERIRVMVQRSAEEDFELSDFKLDTDGCPTGQWKDKEDRCRRCVRERCTLHGECDLPDVARAATSTCVQV